MMPVFFIAGLEGQSYDGLIKALSENDIDLVIDIRLKSDEGRLKEALIKFNALNKSHIGYQWLKVFGNPFYDSEDAFRTIEAYNIYLKGMDKELDELYYQLMKHRCCLVDDVEEPIMPHRVALAEALKKKYGVEYADLTAVKKIVEKYGLQEENISP
ncbi:MAG TPA: DUF488 family protein [Methanocellaceae archaeon]